MMNKPRYWHVAYPLVVTSLCVAPHDYFLKNWMACFEAGLTKLKVGTALSTMNIFLTFCRKKLIEPLS